MRAYLSGHQGCEQVPDTRRIFCKHCRYVCSRCDCERMQFIAKLRKFLERNFFFFTFFGMFYLVAHIWSPRFKIDPLELQSIYFNSVHVYKCELNTVKGEVGAVHTVYARKRVDV